MMGYQWGCFFCAHIILCVIFYFCIRHHSRFQVWSECIIVLLIPFFGLVYMAVIKAAAMTLKKENEQEVYLRLNNGCVTLGGNLQTEVDIVPLHDALYIEDMKEKRALLTNAIKQNVLENKKILRLAMRDADREVSHYAASMLTNQIEKLETRVFQLEERLTQKHDDISLLEEYIDTMREYFALGFLDQASQTAKEEDYIEALKQAVRQKLKREKLYEELIGCLIRRENFAEAEIFCADFAEQFPDTEKPYLAYIKLYTETKNLSAQRRKLTELKAIPEQLSLQALQVIRFWSAGEAKRRVQ